MAERKQSLILNSVETLHAIDFLAYAVIDGCMITSLLKL